MPYTQTVDLNMNGWYLDLDPSTLLGQWTNNDDVVVVDTTGDVAIQVLPEVTVNTLKGDDTISATITGSSYSVAVSAINNAGTIKMAHGDDSITGNRYGGNPGIGIFNSGTIDTGSGKDTITGNGKGQSVYRGALQGIGIVNTVTGIINVGSGDDIIHGTGAGAFDFALGVPATGISNQGTINGGKGKDEIIGDGIGLGANSSGIGISNSGIISGEQGDDSIIGNGTGSSNGYGAGGSGIGISNSGMISGGEGDDSIIGNGTGKTGNPYNGPGSKSYGGIGTGILNTATINLDHGNDVIIGTGIGGKGVWNNGGDGIGIANGASISGGNGDDIFKGIGIGGDTVIYSDPKYASSPGVGIGISITGVGLIETGNGHNQVSGYGTTFGIQGNGLENIGIEGGNGNDNFIARKITGLDPNGNPIVSINQDGAINNVFINAGKGNDVFDVGFGTAKLDGGSGFNTLILPTLTGGIYSMRQTNSQGWFEITNTVSTNVLLVANIDNILSPGGEYISV